MIKLATFQFMHIFENSSWSGQSPQFLVRTGSLRTRSMLKKEEEKEMGGSTCYMLQSGCYLWTGRGCWPSSCIIILTPTPSFVAEVCFSLQDIPHRFLHTAQKGGGQGQGKNRETLGGKVEKEVEMRKIY